MKYNWVHVLLSWVGVGYKYKIHIKEILCIDRIQKYDVIIELIGRIENILQYMYVS